MKRLLGGLLMTMAVAAQAAPRRIVLCLDGTWNSTYDESRRADGTTVLKPTNTLKMCRAVLPVAPDGREQITYYDIGVGSLAEYPGMANRLLHFFDRNLGGPWGAGFEGNVEDALNFLTLNYQPGDEVFIFGFSRGAATAQAITRFLDWSGGVPQKIDAYFLPILFREYVIGHGSHEAAQRARDHITKELAANKRKEPLKPFHPVIVRYLGVWDTVLALGSRFKATGASTASPSRTFHAGKTPAAPVMHARQALAMDEARYDFRPEIWESTNPANPKQRLEQRWFPGVHSNIGGGYDRDGLANNAFEWMLEGANDEGLATNHEYTKHYGGYPYAPLYSSSSLLYTIGDIIRLRYGRGKRTLTNHPETANLTVDPNAIYRLRSSENIEPPQGTTAQPYRPHNLLQFLACQPDLNAYLKSIGVKELDTKPLPPDVTQRIGELRRHCR